MSEKGRKYGTEYKTLLQSGNIKFVQTRSGSATAPMETMTKGRVYVTVNKKNEIKTITYYDKNNRRYKQIDVVGNFHVINGVPTLPHVHKGYNHSEKGTYITSEKEKKMIDRVRKIWYNHIGEK